jgi:hypothetical protein
MVSCTSCTKGFFQNKKGQSISCEACPKGYYAENDQSSNCTKCSVDKTTKRRGMSQCDFCDSGKAGEGCKKCPAGYFRDPDSRQQEGEKECKSCPRGWSQDKIESASCSTCIPGKYQKEQGQAHCKACPQGKYAGNFKDEIDDWSLEDCKRCDNSETKEGSAKCTECPGGKMNYKSQCESCPIGYFREPPGSVNNEATCKICPSGFSTDNKKEGLSECLACNAGMFGTNVSISYTSGTIIATLNSNICKVCPIGLYQDTKQSSKCKACKDPKIANSASTDCEVPSWKLPSDCNEHQYLNDFDNDKNKWKCSKCPVGGICSTMESSVQNKLSVLTDVKYWRIPSKWLKNESYLRHMSFQRCPYPGRCLGDAKNGNHTMVSSCTEGTDTNYPLCAVCKASYTKDGLSKCKKCAAVVIVEKWGLLVLFLVIGLFSLLACKRFFGKELKRLRLLWLDILRVSAIIVTFCQISNSVPITIQIQWRKLFVFFAIFCDFFFFFFFVFY